MKDRMTDTLENEALTILDNLKNMDAGTDAYRANLEDLKFIKEIMEERKDDKFDKILKVITLILKAAEIGAVVASVVICVFADRNGWFVSKLGLGMIPKPRL